MTQVVGTPVATATTPGTMDVPFPSYSAGDSMFVLVGTKQMSTDTFADISGWQTIISVRSSTIVALALYHKIMTGSEGASLTVATIGSNDVNMGIAWVADDLDGTDAIDVIGTEENSSTGDGTAVLPGITAGTGKRLYAAYVGFDNEGGDETATGHTAFTHPGDMTELFDAVTNVGNDLSMGAAYLDTVTGATGDRTVVGTPASLSNYRCLGFLFSANPAAGGTIEKDLTPATETDVAQALSITHGAAQEIDLVPATETSAAQTVSAAKAVTIVAATETSFPASISQVEMSVPAGLSRTRALGGPTVDPSVGPASLTRTRAQGTPTVSPSAAPASLTRTRALGAITVTAGFTLTPASLTRTRALGGPTVNTAALPASLTRTRSLGAITVTAGATGSPDGLVRIRALGGPTMNPQVLPDSLVRARALGGPFGDDGQLEVTGHIYLLLRGVG